MEVTIKINSVKELDKIRKIFEGKRINVTLAQVKPKRKTKKINKITEAVFKKTDNGKDLIYCKDVKDFFNKLGI